jgi:hypothetical protein
MHGCDWRLQDRIEPYLLYEPRFADLRFSKDSNLAYLLDRAALTVVHAGEVKRTEYLTMRAQVRSCCGSLRHEALGLER